VEDYRTIHDELLAYSPDLATREEIVAANKVDLPGTESRRRALEEFCASRGLPFHAISAVTGVGVTALIQDVGARLAARGVVGGPAALHVIARPEA